MMRDFRFRPVAPLDADRSRVVPSRPELVAGLVLLGCCLATRLWLRVFHRLRIEGRENLPATGSFAIVANHASHLDALCLMAMLPWDRALTVHPAAAADYFFRGRPTAALSRWLLNAVPFARGSGSDSSIDQCRRILARRDRVLILFPEGTRARHRGLGRFRSGIGRIVAGTPVPIVPCHLEGTRRAWPKGCRLPRPRNVTLRIGRPRTFAHLPANRAGARHVATMLERDVRSLSRVRTQKLAT